jgi:transcription antitermination protein NusB
MAGIRRRARIAALQALYEIDCTTHEAEQVLAHITADERLPEKALSFSSQLLGGVLRNRSELDAIIRRFASAFPAEQMSVIDRNILRLAMFEMLYQDSSDERTPLKVVINEAIELAKEFGGESSPRLINGVLGALTTERGLGQ